MRAVWKFPIPTVSSLGRFEIDMPLNSLCLHFADQDGVPTIWAEVDVEQPVASKSFKIVGTGHLLDVDPAHRRYVGTCHSGPFVWHLFELIL